MVLNRADAAAIRHTDNHGHCRETLAAVLQPCELAGDLVEGRKDEPVKLNLSYRAIATHRQTDCRSDDSRFGNWTVKDSVFTKLCEQTLGDSKHTAELCNVFTEN